MGYGNLNADIYSQTELNCKKYSVCHPERSEGAGCISMCFRDSLRCTFEMAGERFISKKIAE